MISSFKTTALKILFAILAVSLVLRFAGAARPLLGNFSSVQAIYAMMAQNFSQFGWNLFLPRLDILWNGEPGIRLLDLPLTSYTVAVLHTLTRLPVDLLGRVLSGVFSIASIPLFFQWVKQWADEEHALWAAFFLAFSPLSIVYGQSFQTDAASLFFLILSASLFFGRGKWISAGYFFSLALLLRIQFVFLFPLFAWNLITVPGPISARLKRLILFGVISTAPLIFWNGFIYFYLNQNPNSIIMSIYHQVGTGTFAAYHPWSPFFIKNFLLLAARHVLNPLGLLFALTGFFLPAEGKGEKIFKFWALSIFLMLLSLTKKSIDMNYYWLGLVPPSAYFAAKFGVYARRRMRVPVWACAMTAFFVVLISTFLSFGAAYKTPAEDRSVAKAGHYIDRTVEKDARIIASNGTNLCLLFYSNRKGWLLPAAQKDRQRSPYADFIPAGHQLPPLQQELLSIGQDPVALLEFYRRQGAAYFVCSRPQELKADVLYGYLKAHYALLEENPDFIVFALKAP